MILFILLVIVGYIILKLRQIIAVAEHVSVMEQRGESQENIDRYKERELKKWVPYFLRPFLLE